VIQLNLEFIYGKECGVIKMGEINQIKDYYEEYDEWSRLEKHKVEFEITKRYIDKYISTNSRV
jgi:hypothetical protein